MVLIPYALKYRTTLRGRVPKVVQCEQCGLKYGYVFEASAQGQATSFLFMNNKGASKRSQAAAEKRLLSTLESGCAVVPCPACGRVQQHMFRVARRLYHHWMNKAALAPMFLAAMLFLTVVILRMAEVRAATVLAAFWIAVAVLGACTIGLVLLRFLLALRYDPNSESVELRKQMGQSLAVYGGSGSIIDMCKHASGGIE